MVFDIGVEATAVVTTSSERSFQSALKSKRHLVQQSKENKQARAIVRISLNFKSKAKLTLYFCCCID